MSRYTSCIRHPERERIVIWREWQREACDGNNCAAMLLAFYEFQHNLLLASSARAKATNHVLQMHGEDATQDEGLWQAWSEAQLEEALLFEYGRKTIREANLLLEAKGFINMGDNPEVRLRFDNRKHYLFLPGAVNGWLRLNRPYIEPQPSPYDPDYGEDEEGRDGEVKAPFRAGKNTSTQGKNTSSSGKSAGATGKSAAASGKNDATHKDNRGGSNRRGKREEGAGRALDVPSPQVETIYDIRNLRHPEQLPESHRPPSTVNPEVWVALLRVCRLPLELDLSKAQKIGMNDVGGWLTRGGKVAKDVYDFARRWRVDWRGKDGRPPSIRQIKELWAQIMADVEEVNGNGKSGQNGLQKLMERQQAGRDSANSDAWPG